MADRYPYMISNNKIGSILEKIKSAAKPEKFTVEFLKKLGFVSSNDRAVIPLFKALEFLNLDGVPTANYDRLKVSKDSPYILGERIRTLYDELFQINTQIYKESDEDIKGAFARISGKDDATVNRYTATFKTLCSFAKFDKENKEVENIIKEEKKPIDNLEVNKLNPDFHYNIQIHLPATTDISVYNAIFKSLKENLII